MTKSLKRAYSHADIRSTKRRRTSLDSRPEYSTRDITWEEQLRLPDRFHEAEGVWPALSILEERGSGLKKQYLLEWEPHPETGEIFEPTWVIYDNMDRQNV